jgi:hypothetical protein
MGPLHAANNIPLNPPNPGHQNPDEVELEVEVDMEEEFGQRRVTEKEEKRRKEELGEEGERERGTEKEEIRKEEEKGESEEKDEEEEKEEEEEEREQEIREEKEVEEIEEQPVEEEEEESSTTSAPTPLMRNPMVRRVVVRPEDLIFRLAGLNLSPIGLQTVHSMLLATARQINVIANRTSQSERNRWNYNRPGERVSLPSILPVPLGDPEEIEKQSYSIGPNRGGPSGLRKVNKP